MTLEELKESRDLFDATIATLGNCTGKQIYVAKDLIDAEITRRSLTDEEVQKAIKWLTSVKDHAVVMLDEIKTNQSNVSPMLYEGRKQNAALAITALQQIRREPCWWCKDNAEMIVEKKAENGFQGDVLLSKINYCPNCGRILEGT